MTPKHALSCHTIQKIEKIVRERYQKVRKGNWNRKTKRIKSKLKNKFRFQNDTFFDFSEVGLKSQLLISKYDFLEYNTKKSKKMA